MRNSLTDPQDVLAMADMDYLCGRLSKSHLQDKLRRWIEGNNLFRLKRKAAVKKLALAQASNHGSSVEVEVWFLVRYIRPFIFYREGLLGPCTDSSVAQHSIRPRNRQALLPMPWLGSKEALLFFFEKLLVQGVIQPIPFTMFETHFYYAVDKENLDKTLSCIDLDPIRFKLCDTDLVYFAMELFDKSLVDLTWDKITLHFLKGDGQLPKNLATVHSRLNLTDQKSAHGTLIDSLIYNTKNVPESRIHPEYLEVSPSNTMGTNGGSHGTIDRRPTSSGTAGAGKTDGIPISVRQKNSTHKNRTSSSIQPRGLMHVGKREKT